MIGNTCDNARDHTEGAVSCYSQIQHGNTCVNYLAWKDCDAACDLCACSTGDGSKGEIEHCHGNGVCEATCEQKGCSDAKCKCYEGYGGEKCEKEGI